MIKKLLLYFHTVRYLKPIQIYYQVYYILLNRIYQKPLDLTQKCDKSVKFLNYSIALSNSSFKGDNTFTFLNITHQFPNQIDWEYMEYGKLWQYNLAYFDFLNDKNISEAEGLKLINDFIRNQNKLKSSNEPYPISLRLMNWIRFVSQYQIQDTTIINAIVAQANRLIHRLEYHLLGNHLLENAFALLHIAKFFDSEKFYSKAKSILIEQLNEQILADGGHFELSPMYHQIMLFRVLEAIDLLENSFEEKDSELLDFLNKKAILMLNWLENMTFNNGDIPLSNDAANGITHDTKALKAMAEKLKLNNYSKNPLSTSGFRRYNQGNYEVVLDVGEVGPSYQPGHAHADMLNLTVYHKQKPLLIETGTSTYQINARRHLERSTESHNTVTVNDKSQSEVWSGFRVAKRAKIAVLKDEKNEIAAQHDGYDDTIHKRELKFKTDKIIVNDYLSSNENGVAHWHFHPDIAIKLDKNQVLFEGGNITFEDFDGISIEEFNFAPQFNILLPSKKIKVSFTNKLTTVVSFSK